MIRRVPGILSILIFLLPLNMQAQTIADVEQAELLMRHGTADTATISKLMRMGEAFLEKPESRKEDMEMVLRVAAAIELRGRKMDYPRGIGLGKLLRAKGLRESDGDADERKTVSGDALNLLTKYGKGSERAQAVLELGGSYSNEVADLPRKIELYKEGADYYLQSGDMLSAAKLKEFVGDLLQLYHDYPQALQVLEESRSLYLKAKFNRLHGLYSLMAESYHGANNFVESLRYNLLAVETVEKLQEEGPLVSTIYNRLGLNYYSIRYYDQAIDCFDKALAHSRHNLDTASARSLLLNLADAFRNKGEFRRSLDTMEVVEKLGAAKMVNDKVKIEAIFLKDLLGLNEPEKAVPHYEKLKAFLQTNSADENTNQIARLAIVSLLQAQGRFSETVAYLRDYNAGLQKVPMALNRRADAEYLSFRTDSALDKPKDAILHFQLYKYFSDSLTNINQAKQLGILRLQFESERKDKDIELLTQKSKLQEISIQRGEVFRNVVIGGICMLLLILALVYNRYRLKKKTTFRLEKQQQEINAQNETLKKLVDEKEWLLKEIHHRVKNNLQVIISLLNTQSQYLDNEDAIAAIRNSQHRMYAMSLIHQRLYHADSLGAIDMDWYIRELVGFMKESFDTGSKIGFHVSSESILLDVVQAVPLGLILNEAVSNSIKYAFPDRQNGNIDIHFTKDASGYCLLTVTDNGVGFRNNYRVEESASLGMSLMHGLSEQLEGRFDLRSSHEGVSVQVGFLLRNFNEGI